MKTLVITGHSAITLSELTGIDLRKFADPICESEKRISIREARELAEVDPSLVWCEVFTPRLIESEPAAKGDPATYWWQIGPGTLGMRDGVVIEASEGAEVNVGNQLRDLLRELSKGMSA